VFIPKVFFILAQIYYLDLIYSYHPAWIFIAFCIAGLYSFILYRKSNNLIDVSKKIKLILASIRFVSVFIISILLLGIILEHFISKTEKPHIFIVHDVSESIVQNKDSSFIKNEYQKNLTHLNSKLDEKFEVINYRFSNTVTTNLKSNYTGKLTDISKALDQIYSQYSNKNIGAILLSTDGIYNTGSNPIYSANRKRYTPIYTIGLGDTNEVKDCRIENIFNNDIAFLGNKFPVEVSISQTDFKNSKVKVGIYFQDKLVQSQTIELKSNKEQHKLNFTLNTTKVGFVKYTVKIEELEGEFTYKNNTSNFYIDIIDGRQKIALAHSGIHPDLGALAYVIENNKNYEVDLVNYNELTDINSYDLIICHNYENQNKTLNNFITAGKKPFLFIIGTSTNFNDLNKLNIGLSGSSNKSEDVTFSMNGQFNTIIYPPSISNLLNNAPPLQSPFGSFKFSKSIDILAYQKIGNIKLSDPIIYFNEKNATKYGVIMGEGIWRWRLFDQSRNNTTENFELLFSKIISFLAVKENKTPFKTHLNNEYNESENITILSEFYNSSYDLVNTSEVDFVLTNENNKVFNYNFFKTTNAYKLELGRLPQGIYSWKSSIIFNGKTYNNTGSFLVKEVKTELLTNKANHRLLRNISENTNGSFYFPNELDLLVSDINNRADIVATSYNEKSFEDLIDYKWILFLIITLLSTEWFIRKFNGGY